MEGEGGDGGYAVSVEDIDWVLRSGSTGGPAEEEGGDDNSKSHHNNDGREEEEAEDVALLFEAAEADRSGYGGHSASCRGLGPMAERDCRAALLAASRRRPSSSSPSCDALSFKDGNCYLHDSAASDFWTGASPGHRTQRLRNRNRSQRKSKQQQQQQQQQQEGLRQRKSPQQQKPPLLLPAQQHLQKWRKKAPPPSRQIR